MWLLVLVLVTVVLGSGVGALRFTLATRRLARRRQVALGMLRASPPGRVQELDGLVFDLATCVRALISRGDQGVAAAEALLGGRPGVDAWLLVDLLVSDRGGADAPLVGESRRAVHVPGLVETACATCRRRHAGPALILRRSSMLQAGVGRGRGGSIRYSGLCPEGHPLPALQERLTVVN